MKRFRVIGKEWCELRVQLEDRDGKRRFSISGSYGRVIPSRSAKRLARDFWQSFFEESREELAEFALKWGKRTPRTAANYVLEVDGDFHGLDVHKEDAGRLYLTESCGQIREELIRFFPDCEPYLKWHLNDMKAGCEHQEALGWGHGKDIALSKDDLTPAQRETLEKKALQAREKAREKFKKELMEKAAESRYECQVLCKKLGYTPTVDKLDEMMSYARCKPDTCSEGLWKVRRDIASKVREYVEQQVQPKPVESAIYKDSLCAPCPECGYEYGTQWLYRELPPDVIIWATQRGDSCLP